MRQRARTLLATLVIAVVTTAGAAPAIGESAGPPDLKAAVGTAMRAELGAQTQAAYGQTEAALQTLVEPKRYSADRNWVFGGAVFLVPRGTHAGPVTALFVANRTSRRGAWTVTLEGTEEFAAMSHRAPASVVKQDERALFARTAAPAAAADIGLALPWKQGQGWAHWGVHGNSGTSRPYNSIDFYGGDGRVLTARAGTMYRFCTTGGQWPFIKVVHDNGYTTGYYHLRDTTSKGDGSSVALGEYVGMIDEQLPCGGSANGDHVHWTLWQGNTAIAVQGKTIGGWTWWEGSAAYQGYAERGGTRVNRNICCPIINYGSTGGPGGRFFESTTNYNVPDLGTVESSITVTGVSGNAPASLQVYQDIHHTWRGDLQVDLIGPSGRAYRLRDPSADDDADIIHETDSVNASTETANGVWKLRVKDTSTNDSGYIDAWNLTF